MSVVLKRQIDEMTEEELREVLRRDYVRRLTRYKMIDNFYRNKYSMDFLTFQEKNIVDRENYTFEVESSAQEWELAIDGIKTVKRKLQDLSNGD